MQKCLDWYFYKGWDIKYNKKYGGWVIGGDWNLYKALRDTKNQIDKDNDRSTWNGVEPRVLRQLSKDEFIFAFSD